MAAAPHFEQVNVVVSDMDAAAAFYRVLGVEMNASADPWPPGTGARHANPVDHETAGDFDLDNEEMARFWGHAGLRAGETVIGFSLATRDDVDETYQRLMAAGYTGRREPYDAFFGARYAVVEDPDGHPVGLMSPRDPERRSVPEP